MKKQNIVIIGGGPAGMMAAIAASSPQTNVTLVEKNEDCGAKLLLTGKGRCNVTNRTSLNDFLPRFSGRQGQFLRDAFKVHFNEDTIRFFEERGLTLVTERQERVFPASGKSLAVLRTLKKELLEKNVNILFNHEAKDILVANGKVNNIILSNGERIPADKIIVATGGMSYKFTGSTGDGFKWAKKWGHTVTPLRPGLVPLEIRQSFIKSLSGIVLRNIRLKFVGPKKPIVSEIGELNFLDTGIAGALVFSHSANVIDCLKDGAQVFVEIDLKPALSEAQLEARLSKDAEKLGKENIKMILKDYLPQQLIETVLLLSDINGSEKLNQLSVKQRQKLVRVFKGFKLEVSKSFPIDKAMVTHGGVNLKEINPKTMESKLISGLHFCGETLDVDGDTGGFNLQAAFSTGFLAGQSASKTQE